MLPRTFERSNGKYAYRVGVFGPAPQRNEELVEEQIEEIIPEVTQLSDVFADLVTQEHLQSQLLLSYVKLGRLIGGELAASIGDSVDLIVKEKYLAKRTELIDQATELMLKIDGASLVLFMLANKTASNVIENARDVGTDDDIDTLNYSLLSIWAAYTYIMIPFVSNQIDATGICPFCGGDATDENHNDVVVIAGPTVPEDGEGEDANA